MTQKKVDNATRDIIKVKATEMRKKYVTHKTLEVLMRCAVSPTFARYQKYFVDKILARSPKGVLKSQLYEEKNAKTKGYPYM